MCSEISLPIGRLPFADRVDEQKGVWAFLNSREVNSPRALFFKTRKGSGFTRFVFRIMEDAPDNTLPVYLDATSTEPNLLFSEFFRCLAQTENRIARKGKELLATRAKQVLETLASTYSDLDGPGARTMGKVAEIVGGSYRSASFERFREVTRGLPHTINIVFLIDNAQKSQNELIDTMANMSSSQYSRIKFVIGFCESDGTCAEELLNRLMDAGLPTEHRCFPPPTADLLNEIVLATKSVAPIQLLRKVIRDCNNNLHRAIARLRSPNPSNPEVLSPASRRLLSLLAVAGQSLPLSDLRTILSVDLTVFVPESKAWFEEVLFEVNEYVSILGDGESVHFLRSPQDTVSSSERLQASETLYQFYRQKMADVTSLKLNSLLHRLSISVDPASTAMYAERLVKIALRGGEELVAKRFFPETKDLAQSDTYEEYLLRVAFLLTTKRYLDANEALSTGGVLEWRETELCFLLKSVALNRLRKHRESLKIISRLMDAKSLSREQLVIALSFRIGGLIHSCRRSTAYKAFKRDYKRLSEARNFAYLLRNGASACDSSEAIEFSRKAIQIFRKTGDEYGQLTTLNNLGVFEANEDKFDRAYKHFSYALNGLHSYGLIHIEEALVNKGICAMSLNDLDEAESILRRCLTLASDNVPRYYAAQSLAAVHSLRGDTKKCLNLLSTAFKSATRIGILPHLQRYILNSALIAALCAPKSKLAYQFLERAKRSGYCHAPTSAAFIIETVESERVANDNLVSLMLKPFMFYWAQEPIYVLDELRSPQTIGEN